MKEKNSTVWNWICTASDEFHCFFCSLQVPQEYVASDASWRFVCHCHCLLCTLLLVTLKPEPGEYSHNFSFTCCFQQTYEWEKKNSKFERSNRSRTKSLVHHWFFHSLVFWKEVTVYLRSCIYAYNLRLLKKKKEKKYKWKKRNSKGKAGLKRKSTFHAWISTFFWNEAVRTFPIISSLWLFREL